MPTNAERILNRLANGAQHDERLESEFPVGFVYFTEGNYDGQDVRVGYISNPATEPDNPEALPVQRFAPYLFPANWGEPTLFHLIAAWDYLVAHNVGAFAAAAAEHVAHPVVRWMNGRSADDFILADRYLMLIAAERERKKAQRTSKYALMRP